MQASADIILVICYILQVHGIYVCDISIVHANILSFYGIGFSNNQTIICNKGIR